MQIFIKSLTTVILSAILAIVSVGTANAVPLYATARSDADLRVLNQASGGVDSSVTMTLAGSTILGTNSLAWDSSTGTLWGLLRLSGVSARELVTIDPITGVATSVGNTGISGGSLRFSGLDFDSSGTLFGVTGDGSIPSETLRTLSQVDASSAAFMPLGNGNDGETIAYNWDDGLMYHLSGFNSANVVFESIDLAAMTTSNIFTGSGNLSFDEGNAFTYAGGGNFFTSSITSNGLYSLTSAGTLTFIGGQNFDITGLAFARVSVSVPEPATLSLLFVGLLGFGLTRRRRRAA